MKITSFDIERFGVWENLHLPKISRGLNLFYGPNEAGKTTLLHFLRTGLYGAASDDRARYIRTSLGDEAAGDAAHSAGEAIPSAGGALSVRTEFGEYRIDRRFIRRNTNIYDRSSALEARAGFVVEGGLAQWSGRFYPLPGRGIAESLIVSGPDGARLSDYFVKTLTGNVDEATFNNVFAIGLDELQRLGTLDDTDAAQMLYRLSVGVDRVSLIQVLHQIVDERNEIFHAKGTASILETLLAQRSRLTAESQRPAALMRDYLKTVEQRNETEAALAKIAESLARHRRSARLYELARNITGIWDRRAQLQERITAAGTVPEVEEDALAEADRLSALVSETAGRLADLKQEYTAARKNLLNIKFSEAVRKNAVRIDLIGEELPRIQALLNEIAEKNDALALLQEELHQEEERLKGIKQGKVTLSRNIVDAAADRNASDDSLPAVDYRVLAKGMRTAAKRHKQVKAQLAEVNSHLAELVEKLEQELSARGQKGLNEALESTSSQVSRLRRRLEIGRRLAEMEKRRRDLVAQNEHLASTQSLPLPLTLGIAALVAVGGLVAALAFFGKANIDMGVGVMGLIAAIAGVVYKNTTEKKNYAALLENQRQLSHLTRQMTEAKDEAGAIDSEFPAGGQTVEIRLQKAESDLAAFERLVPVEASWKETAHHAKVLENRQERTAEAVKKSKKRWVNWLKGAGLSEDLEPSAIRALLERADVAESLHRRIDAAGIELDLLDRERKEFAERLARLFTAARVTPPADHSFTAQYAVLREALDTVHRACEQRKTIQRQMAQMRKNRRTLLDEAHRQRHELLDFLSLFETKTIEELAKKGLAWREYRDLMGQLDDTRRQIAAAIGNFCPESEINALLSNTEIRAELATRQTETEDRIAALETDRAEKEQLRGRLSEQLAGLAARKESVKTRFDAAAVDVRIHRMAAMWQSRAVACKMMEDIRRSYEKERQPETLREASRYLRRLTDGRYVKIWTPLGEDTLYIDTDEGKSLDVAALSRGLREQLFIAIRLALIGTFEKHGISLPMVFDDVLVNFDNRRAVRAAKMFRELADAGQQIFLFTCHEHICKTFLELGTPVFVLPERTERLKRFRVLLPETITEEPAAEPAALPEPPAAAIPVVTVPSATVPIEEPAVPAAEQEEERTEPQTPEQKMPEQKESEPQEEMLEEPEAVSEEFAGEPAEETAESAEEAEETAAEEPAEEVPEELPAEPEPIKNFAEEYIEEAAEEPVEEPAEKPEPVLEPKPISEPISQSIPEPEPEPVEPVLIESAPVEPAPAETAPPETVPEPVSPPKTNNPAGLGLLDLFIGTNPDEEQVDRVRRMPLEISQWDDLFPRPEPETPEPEPEEEPEIPLASDETFIPETVEHLFPPDSASDGE